MNAAVAGLGWWGRHICSALRGSTALRVVHGVDPDTEAAAPFAAGMGVTLSPSLSGALADPAVQAVILATPHSQHVEQVVASAAAGRHVFCEKPLALTRSGAERAIEACAAAGVVLSVGHERRFEPPIVALRQMVASGELGTVLQVEANYGHNMLAQVDPGHWRSSAAESPGAGLTGIGSHLVDIYTSVFGPVTEVRALCAQRATSRAGGDVLSVQFRFASGAFGYLGNVSASPFYGRITAYGSKAWVESRARQHMQAAGATELVVCRLDGNPVSQEWAPVDTVRANLEAFAAAAAGEATNPYDPAQVLHAIAVLEGIVRSIASGQPEAVA